MRRGELYLQSQDLAKFGKMIKLVSFAPFHGAAQALENANEVSEGIASEFLLSLLEVNLPKAGKKNKITLGVSDKGLAGAIKGAFPGLECETGDTSEVVCLTSCVMKASIRAFIKLAWHVPPVNAICKTGICRW